MEGGGQHAPRTNSQLSVGTDYRQGKTLESVLDVQAQAVHELQRGGVGAKQDVLTVVNCGRELGSVDASRPPAQCGCRLK